MEPLKGLPRPNRRPRRLRRNAAIRGLVRETRLTPDRLVLPLFVTEGQKQLVPIEALPGHARLSIDLLVEKCREALELGVNGFALFPMVKPSILTTCCAGRCVRSRRLCRKPTW
jgi:porphobilinogen synthase